MRTSTPTVMDMELTKVYLKGGRIYVPSYDDLQFYRGPCGNTYSERFLATVCDKVDHMMLWVRPKATRV